MPTRCFLIADRQPLFRMALRSLLTDRFQSAEIVEVHGIDPLIEVLLGGCRPDLVLLDPCSPFNDGLAQLEHVLVRHRGLPVLVISEIPTVATASHVMGLGARGLVPKTAAADEFSDAIDGVLAGRTWFPEGAQQPEQVDAPDITALMGRLSRQQVRVLRLLGQGLLNKQIAYGLGIGETTVKAHISAILRKLGAANRTQAAMMVSRISGAGWPRAGSVQSQQRPDEQAGSHLETQGSSI